MQQRKQEMFNNNHETIKKIYNTKNMENMFYRKAHILFIWLWLGSFKFLLFF